MEKYRYLKTDDKNNLMKVSSLVSTVDDIVLDIAKYKPQEKSLNKSFKTGLTYIKKGLKEMTGAMNVQQLEEVIKYVDSKDVVILDKNKTRIMTNKTHLRDEEMAVNKEYFNKMCDTMKREKCNKCDGIDYNMCGLKEIMISTCQDGKENYKNCPFEFSPS